MGVLVAAACLSAGAGLAAAAMRFGDAAPIAFLAIPVAPLVAVAVILSPLFGVLTIVASFPIGSDSVGVGVLNIQAVEAAVFVSALVVAIRRLAVGSTPLPFAAPLGWGLALFMWTLIAFLFAIDKTLALKPLFAVLGGVTAASLVLAACRNMDQLRILMLGMVVVAAGISATTVPNITGARTEYGGSLIVTERLQGAFDHPNQLASFLALTAPIAAGLVFALASRRAQLLAGAALVVILAGLMAALSRGAWIAAAAAAIVLLARLREARRLLAILTVPLLIVGAFLWSLAPSTAAELEIVGERAGALTLRSPYDHRDVIYKEALRQMRDEPLVGQGPGGFPIASKRPVSEAATLSYAHAHNLYLHWGAEAGLPALAIIFGFGVALAWIARSVARRALARGDPLDRALILGIGAALLTIAVQGCFDYTVGNPVIHVAFWMLVGALLVARREMGTPTAPSGRS